MQSNRTKTITASILKKNTVKNYEFIFYQFQDDFGDRLTDSITLDEIFSFDVQDRKITLPDPKSGKESDVVFIPQKAADRLKDYIMRMKKEKNGPWVKLFGCEFGLLTR